MKTFGELKVGDTIYGMGISASSGKADIREIIVAEIEQSKHFEGHVSIDFKNFNSLVVEKNVAKLHNKHLHIGFATSIDEAKKLKKEMEEYFRDPFKDI